MSFGFVIWIHNDSVTVNRKDSDDILKAGRMS
jgi:hypothetical protein